jgi:hypothetical protein
MVDDQADEFDLIRCRRFAIQESVQSALCGLAIQANQRPQKESETITIGLGTSRCYLSSTFLTLPIKALKCM